MATLFSDTPIHQPTGQLIAHPHPSTPIQRLRHHLRAPLAAASVSLHAWHFDDPNEVMKLAEIGAFRFFLGLQRSQRSDQNHSPNPIEALKRSSSEVVLGQGKVANDFYAISMTKPWCPVSPFRDRQKKAVKLCINIIYPPCKLT